MKHIASPNTPALILFAPVILIVAALAVTGIMLLRSYEQSSILPGIHAAGSFETLPVIDPGTPVVIAVIEDPELPASIATIPAASKLSPVRQMRTRSQAPSQGQSALHPPVAPAKVPETIKPIVEDALSNKDTNGHVGGVSTDYTPPPPIQPTLPPAGQIITP